MLRIALALALLASTPVEAHCFARWYYPWPQRCQVAGHRTREMERGPQAPSRRVALIVTPTVGEQDLLPSSAACCADIPLPSLARADCDGGEADEPTRAKVLLRAALEAADARPLQ